MKADNPALSGGFTQIPNSFFDAQVSPLAQLVLFYLCKFANDKGESFHQLKSIGAQIGRSKASVSNSLTELREAGYIQCIRQKNKMGYNISLKIRVKGWADIKAYWKKLTRNAQARRNQEEISTHDAARVDNGIANHKSPLREVDRADHSNHTNMTSNERDEHDHSVVKKTERPVQPVERKDPKGLINNIHRNQYTAASVPLVWSSENEKAWKKFRPSDSDPVTVSMRDPEPALLEHAMACAARLEHKIGLPSQEEMRVAATHEITAFVDKNKLCATVEEVEEAAQTLMECAKTKDALKAAMELLDATWQPHWRKLSKPSQLTRTVKGVSRYEGVDADRLANLVRWQNRACAARIWLTSKSFRKSSSAALSTLPARTKYRQSDLEACAA